jgi:hypothetical protein
MNAARKTTRKKAKAGDYETETSPKPASLMV